MPLAVAFLVPPDTFRRVFTPADLVALQRDPRVELLTERPLGPSDPLLARAELLVTGWGSPVLGPDLLDRAPRLRAVAHSAGSVRPVVDDAVWARGIAVTSSASANAVPVAEFTVSVLVLAAKGLLPGTAPSHVAHRPEGFHGLTIGVVGASRVGRAVIARLRGFDVDVVVHDPYLDPAEAAALGVAPVGLLDLARASDVVSLHAPALPETAGMIDAEFLQAMRPGATFVNTARGSLVDHEALADRLDRGDLQAVLDVTDPEPLPAGHRLRRTPNTALTPHVAGSSGNELRRLARNVVTETRAFAATGTFLEPILPDALALQA